MTTLTTQLVADELDHMPSRCRFGHAEGVGQSLHHQHRHAGIVQFGLPRRPFATASA